MVLTGKRLGKKNQSKWSPQSNGGSVDTYHESRTVRVYVDASNVYSLRILAFERSLPTIVYLGGRGGR